MTFGFHNLPFDRELVELTRRTSAAAFVGTSPQALYHYTSRTSAESIIQSRRLWATCLTEQTDLTELTHGIALAERLCLQLIDEERNLFVKKILAELAEYMRTRRSMFFILCFCTAHNSRHHLKNYGDVCLTLNQPLGKRPALELDNQMADSWFAPVIYGEKLQENAVRSFLRTTCLQLDKHSYGKPEDDNAGWIRTTPLRNIGQCLLTIISLFKREIYKRDAEWRLVLGPILGLSNSAPNLIDDYFASSIVASPKRHICLRRAVPFVIREGMTWPPSDEERGLPFDEIVWPPDVRD